jgi:hypothetical protein
MTYRTTLVLECDECRNPFPAVGNCPSPVDGAIYTPTMLRVEASDEGWTRRRDESRAETIDLCPRCDKKWQKRMKRK